MSETPRFSKSSASRAIWARADAAKARELFDPGNGWAQLIRGKQTDESIALLNRAIAYGRFRALEEIAQAIDDGDLIR